MNMHEDEDRIDPLATNVTHSAPPLAERILLICSWNEHSLRYKTAESLAQTGTERTLMMAPHVLTALGFPGHRRKRFSCNLMNTRMMIEGLVLPSPNEVKVGILACIFCLQHDRSWSLTLHRKRCCAPSCNQNHPPKEAAQRLP